MCRIRIIRKKEGFNKNIDYQIFVDGQKITSLKYAEEKILEFKEESQFLQAKMVSGSSEKLAVDKLETGQVIEISGDRFKNKYLKYAGALIPLIGLPFILNMDYKLIKTIGGVLLIVYLLFIAYMLIFHRRKWLKLKLIH